MLLSHTHTFLVTVRRTENGKWRKEEESVQAPNCRTAIHGVFSADNDDCGLFVCSSATEAFFFISFFSLLLNCFVSGLDGGKKAEEGQPFSTLGSSHRCCRWRQRHAVVKSGLHRSTHCHRLTPFPTGRKLAQYFIKWVSRLFTATYTWHTIQLLAQPRDLRAQPNCRCCCLKGCRLEFN